jgi:hypothetical protein
MGRKSLTLLDLWDMGYRDLGQYLLSTDIGRVEEPKGCSDAADGLGHGRMAAD